jgi:Spy/CpxP family protein refolding chaperone
MKNKLVILALTSFSLTISPLLAWAGNDDSAQYLPMKKKMAELNLTADQQGKLLALHKEKNAEAKPLFDQMKAIRDKVKAELLKSEPSKQALDNFASQLGDLHRQLVRNMNEHLLKVKAILTPDQFSKLVNFDWMGSGPGMHPGMHHGMGGHGSDKDSE